MPATKRLVTWSNFAYILPVECLRWVNEIPWAKNYVIVTINVLLLRNHIFWPTWLFNKKSGLNECCSMLTLSNLILGWWKSLSLKKKRRPNTVVTVVVFWQVDGTRHVVSEDMPIIQENSSLFACTSLGFYFSAALACDMKGNRWKELVLMYFPILNRELFRGHRWPSWIPWIVPFTKIPVLATIEQWKEKAGCQGYNRGL